MRLPIVFQLIYENQLPLSEIAYESGFSSLGYFTRTFKKYYGKTPSELRS